MRSCGEIKENSRLEQARFVVKGKTLCCDSFPQSSGSRVETFRVELTYHKWNKGMGVWKICVA